MQAFLKRPLKMGGLLTFPYIHGGEMGYTWSATTQQQRRNFVGQTPYSFKPDHHIPGSGGMAQSIMFMVKFLASNQTKEATLDTTKMYKQEYVTRQIAQQHPTDWW